MFTKNSITSPRPLCETLMLELFSKYYLVLLCTLAYKQMLLNIHNIAKNISIHRNNRYFKKFPLQSNGPYASTVKSKQTKAIIQSLNIFHVSFIKPFKQNSDKEFLSVLLILLLTFGFQILFYFRHTGVLVSAL